MYNQIQFRMVISVPFGKAMSSLTQTDSRFFIWEENPMIKKSIASILIILMLLNSVACYSLRDVNVEDTDTIKKYESAKLTTLDDKVYYLIDVEVQETKINGVDSKNTQKGIIQFRKEDIKHFEVNSIDLGFTLLTIVGVVGVTCGLLYLVFSALWDK